MKINIYTTDIPKKAIYIIAETSLTTVGDLAKRLEDSTLPMIYCDKLFDLGFPQGASFYSLTKVKRLQLPCVVEDELTKKPVIPVDIGIENQILTAKMLIDLQSSFRTTSNRAEKVFRALEKHLKYLEDISILEEGLVLFLDCERLVKISWRVEEIPYTYELLVKEKRLKK